MEFIDRLLTCADCGGEFIFTAGEQLFFFDKQFKNDPKRCKPCKLKKNERIAANMQAFGQPFPRERVEVSVKCALCGVETTVPFRPTQGRPVYCRDCFLRMRASSQGRCCISMAGLMLGDGEDYRRAAGLDVNYVAAPQAITRRNT